MAGCVVYGRTHTGVVHFASTTRTPGIGTCSIVASPLQVLKHNFSKSATTQGYTKKPKQTITCSTMSDLQSDELRGAPQIENYQDRDFCLADEQEPAFEEHQVPSQLLESSVNTRPYRHALKVCLFLISREEPFLSATTLSCLVSFSHLVGALCYLLLLQFEFPFKLHELLEDAATRDGNEHIVSWHPDGTAFTIHLKEEFETQIIPQYFPKAPKYRSFCRQLSIYGYKMDQDASSKYFRAYRHPLMVRGNPGMCAWMVREKVKGSSSSSSSSKTRISEHAACSRSQQQQKYKMEDESFVQQQQEEETTADHPVSILHGGGVSLPNVLGPPSSPPAISRKKAAAQEMSSSLITAVHQEGDIRSDRIEDDDLLQFAIAANAYLEDSPSSEISSPVAAAAKDRNQEADDFFSTINNQHMFSTHPQKTTQNTLQAFNDDPLELATSLMYNHNDLQGSESMILDAIRRLLSSRPHRQSISSVSSFRSS